MERPPKATSPAGLQQNRLANSNTKLKPFILPFVLLDYFLVTTSVNILLPMPAVIASRSEMSDLAKH